MMWMPGGLVFLIAISTVVFFRWQGAGGDDMAVGPAKATHGG